MAVIVTRAGKGTFLTFTEMDSNFTNLNTAKVEKDGSVGFDNGTAAAPSLKFRTNDGMYSSAANTLDVTINGVRVGGFNSTGYIGNIGAVTYTGSQNFAAGATVPTMGSGDNSTNAASTAFVQAAIASAAVPATAVTYGQLYAASVFR